MLQGKSKLLFFITCLSFIFSSSIYAETIVTETTPVTVAPATTVTAPVTTVMPVSDTQAVVIQRPETIITTVPAPKETIVVPTGYSTCFTVKSGWYQNVWVAEHKVCQYSGSEAGVAWVDGYWSCTKYDNAQGICTNWDWKSGRWEKTFTVY